MIWGIFFHPQGSIFEVFWHPWRPFGPPRHPERFKTSFCCSFFRLLVPFGGPSGAQESPREPQGAQKCSKRHPKWYKKAPKVAPSDHARNSNEFRGSKKAPKVAAWDHTRNSNEFRGPRPKLKRVSGEPC